MKTAFMTNNNGFKYQDMGDLVQDSKSGHVEDHNMGWRASSAEQVGN